jgi:hypothetical protein
MSPSPSPTEPTLAPFRRPAALTAAARDMDALRFRAAAYVHRGGAESSSLGEVREFFGKTTCPAVRATLPRVLVTLRRMHASRPAVHAS